MLKMTSTSSSLWSRKYVISKVLYDKFKLLCISSKMWESIKRTVSFTQQLHNVRQHKGYKKGRTHFLLHHTANLRQYVLVVIRNSIFKLVYYSLCVMWWSLYGTDSEFPFDNDCMKFAFSPHRYHPATYRLVFRTWLVFYHSSHITHLCWLALTPPVTPFDIWPYPQPT